MSNIKNSDYEIFKAQYKKVVAKSDNAISIESDGNRMEAYALYKNIIIDLENVMAINVVTNDLSIRNEIRNKKKRLQWLRNNIYDCIERLGNIKGGIASLVYSIKNGCQYSTIDNSGMVISSLLGSLELYQFPVQGDEIRGFLIVSDWMTPLIFDVTPVMLSSRGALIFLDIDKQCKVAVTLPYDIQLNEFQKFITILSSLSFFVMDDKSELTNVSSSTGDMIANGLDKVSRVLSTGIEIGTTKLTELIKESSEDYCQSTVANNEPVAVNPNVKTGLHYARVGSHCLVEISGKAFGMFVRTTQYFASKAAPHIKSAADNYIPIEWKKSGENGEKSTVDQIAVVTGATINGFSRLCSSLHDGAVVFGRNFTRDTSNVLTHRYGPDVGLTTENALYSVGNIGMTAFTAMSFTKKGLIKSTAKIAGTEIVSEYNKQSRMATT